MSHFNKLCEFLKAYRVNRGDKFTHTSMGKPFGSYYIPKNKRKKFMKLYKNAWQEGADLHITEAHRLQGPIVIDIDWKYESETCERIYKPEHIKQIVESYNRVIKKYLVVPDEEMDAFVMEKPVPTFDKENKVCKDGIHIQYPYISCIWQLRHVFREEVLKEFEDKGYFDDFNLINSLEDVFDKAVVKENNWLIYGGLKPDKPKYQLTKIYDNEADEIEIEVDEKNLPDLLSIRKFNKDTLTPYQKEVKEDEIRDRYKKIKAKNKQVFVTTEKLSDTNHQDLIRKAKHLTAFLNPGRADSYHPWIELGWCLHNISETLLDEWIEFSKLCPAKYRPGDCERLWGEMKDEGFGFGSLCRWAKEDNPTAYKEFQAKELEQCMRNSFSGTSYAVAKLFYEHYKFDFVCASITFKMWYAFRGHRWVPVDQGYPLMEKLNVDMFNHYMEESSKLSEAAQAAAGDEKDILLNRQILCTKIATKLRTIKFKKEVMEECKNLFYDEKFLDKLDEQRDLLGFENGVYDLEKNIFRDGRPEDCISLSTGINYREFKMDDPKVREVYKFFREIQPDADMREYVLDFLCSCLQGHTPDEKFHIWTGSGGNGKSLTVDLFMAALGEYCATLPITLLTQKRASSNAATPEMARCKGTRFVVFQEPEGNDKIHVGHMKELTGGDKVQARALYKEPIEFYPQFKTILTANKLPFIPSNDGGTWRRIRVVPYEMKFVDEPTEPYHRKIDRTLKLKMETWAEPFMAILIHRFQNYKKNGLIEPTKVTCATNQYQTDSDVFLEFINERIELTNDSKDVLKITNLFIEFKAWHKEAHSDKKCPSRSDLRYDFEDKFGNMNNGWKCMKFKSGEEDSEYSSDGEEEEVKPKKKLIQKKASKKTSPKKKTPHKKGGLVDALDSKTV